MNTCVAPVWNSESELSFLEIYQAEPVLWEPTHKYHKDKKKINDAWVRISEETGISIKELKTKKDSLMATFRKHKRLLKKSLLSGSGSEDVYKPIWFAYSFMDSFLGHLYECKKTTNTENDESIMHTEEIGFNGGPSQDGTIIAQETRQSSETPDSVMLTPPPPPPSSVGSMPPTQRRRKHPPELLEAGENMREAMNTLNRVLNKKEVKEDDCDYYGKILANKLRQVPENERLRIMYEINGIFIRRINSVQQYASIPPRSYRRSSSSVSSYPEALNPNIIINEHRPPSSQSVHSPIVDNFNNEQNPSIQQYASFPLRSYRRSSSSVSSYPEALNPNIIINEHRPPSSQSVHSPIVDNFNNEQNPSIQQYASFPLRSYRRSSSSVSSYPEPLNPEVVDTSNAQVLHIPEMPETIENEHVNQNTNNQRAMSANSILILANGTVTSRNIVNEAFQTA